MGVEPHAYFSHAYPPLTRVTTIDLKIGRAYNQFRHVAFVNTVWGGILIRVRCFWVFDGDNWVLSI